MELEEGHSGLEEVRSGPCRRPPSNRRKAVLASEEGRPAPKMRVNWVLLKVPLFSSVNRYNLG
jgi:hypothetical protein